MSKEKILLIIVIVCLVLREISIGLFNMYGGVILEITKYITSLILALSSSMALIYCCRRKKDD